jgi:hemerythrin-like domain-containing protein
VGVLWVPLDGADPHAGAMTATQHSTSAQPIDVHDMVVVHRVFRRELIDLSLLIRQVAPGDIDRAAVVAGHARLVLSGLHLHHTSEDDLLWPTLLERAAPSADLVHHLQTQHACVEERLTTITPLLTKWGAEARPAVAAETADAFADLHVLVVEHLDDEERTILPIAARSLTQDEWASIGQAGVAKMTRSELPLMFGAVLEGATPEERAEILAVLPAPVRLLMRTWGMRRYGRYITRVRGGR